MKASARMLIVGITAILSLIASPLFAVVTLDNPAQGFEFWETQGAWFSGTVGGPSAPTAVVVGFKDMQSHGPSTGWLVSRTVIVEGGSFGKSVPAPAFEGEARAMVFSVDYTQSDEHTGLLHRI